LLLVVMSIDNVVWTDSWPSIPGEVAACFALEQVEKGLCLAGPLRSGETSRSDSRDPVASGSSASRIVARKARRCRQSELVQGSSSRPESARGVCGGSPENR
jgi:hypothetical protein